MTDELFIVEDATYDDGTDRVRPVIHEGAHYFPALEAFRKVSLANPGRRYVMSVNTDQRSRFLHSSDNDNVIRVAAGLLPVWHIPGATYAEALGK